MQLFTTLESAVTAAKASLLALDAPSSVITKVITVLQSLDTYDSCSFAATTFHGLSTLPLSGPLLPLSPNGDASNRRVSCCDLFAPGQASSHHDCESADDSRVLTNGDTLTSLVTQTDLVLDFFEITNSPGTGVGSPRFNRWRKASAQLPQQRQQ